MDLYEDKVSFQTKKGTELYLINDKVVGSKIQVARVKSSSFSSSHSATLGMLDLIKNPVEVEVLKAIGVWDKLTKEIQDKINGIEVVKQKEVREKMALARSKRKKKYADLPEMLTCKCGAQVKANYTYLQKKADAKHIPLMDLVNGYQCQKCNPTKGRGKRKRKGKK